MASPEEKKRLLNDAIYHIMEGWYERCKPHYVTEEESRQLGVEPELKYFEDQHSFRIKFGRAEDLDVTYGLSLIEVEGQLVIVSSVNNKTTGFDLDAFMEKLKAYYWRARNEKPWTRPAFDRYTYEDVMPFEPHLGGTVFLDARESRADIVRLHFLLNPDHEDQLLAHGEILGDLIENYCLSPLRRTFAEAYTKQS